VTWTAPEVTRAEPPNVADERTALQGWLDYHRATLRWKCTGLTGDQLVLRPVASSTLSLLGLIRHMTEVERSWFRRRFGGRGELPPLYYSDEQPDGDFDFTDPARAKPTSLPSRPSAWPPTTRPAGTRWTRHSALASQWTCDGSTCT
jgi:hypothetical protein